MNSDSPSGGAGSPESSQRKDRAAIAAQACETCRTRKSKCDEKRPQCSLCKRLSVACFYREPQPTKKDKTLVDILASLQRIENKFDTVGSPLTPSSATAASINLNPRTPQSDSYSVSELENIGKHPIEAPHDHPKAFRHVTAAHKVLLWPCIHLLFLDTGSDAALDIPRIKEDGTPWFLKLDLAKHSSGLPAEHFMSRSPTGTPDQHTARSKRVRFPALPEETIKKYVWQYFDTYNVLYPLLDKTDFCNKHLWQVIQNGFGDQDLSSILCLLVLALGKVADVVQSRDHSSYVGAHSNSMDGITPEHPPGLEIFNEARKRLGFTVSQCNLENIQIMLLTSIYFSSCGRHLDFWRLSVTASMTCQVYVKCTSLDWNSQHGDIVKRNYWTCNLIENWYHLDLDLPRTGINELEEEVPFPMFAGQQSSNNNPEERVHVQLPFLAMIALRRLTTRAHAAIFDSVDSTAESEEHYTGPPIHVIAELSRQLDDWRSVLPRALQWKDKDKLVLPSTDIVGGSEEAHFSSGPHVTGPPFNHRYNMDIMTAQLRTRYYFARFIMYRPFVYKALHYPNLMTSQDVECVVLCLESSLSWPIIMYPPKAKKRLVPSLFAWTQHIVGILLILRMSLENNLLRRISQQRISQGEIKETVRLMLDWLRDAKDEDGTAEWCWNAVYPLYQHLFASAELN